MREIKFRAWYLAGEMINDIRGFEYYEDQEEKIDIWKPMIRIFEKDGDSISYPYGSIILMQFTGLKDKNGKEIFEGDIIKQKSEVPEVVIWDEKFAQFLTKPSPTIQYYIGGDCEIIGNIHETPTLLKSEE